MNLDQTTRRLCVSLGQTSTSSFPQLTVTYKDYTQNKIPATNSMTEFTSLTTSTSTFVCAAPPQTIVREFENIVAHQRDAASTLMSIFIYDGTTSTNNMQWKGVLQPLESVYYSQYQGWYGMTSSMVRK